MNKIIRDYRRSFRRVPIGYWLCAVFIAAGFVLSGTLFGEKTRIPAAVLMAFVTLVSLWATLDVMFFMPNRFKKRLDSLPGNTREELIAQYEKAPNIGGKWFLEEYLLFHRNRRIEILRYDDIRSAEPKGLKAELKLLDGKTEFLPLEPDENPAVLVAALRSKNPQISVMINGKVVECMENDHKGKESSQ